MPNKEIHFVYFGGEPIGVPVLIGLQAAGLSPSLIIASPDRPVGRKQVMTPPPVKVWAEERGIEVWQPETWRGDEARATATAKLQSLAADVFVVVAYNHILPQWLLDLSPNGVINVHPSLLPKLRGASPIRTAIKDDLRDQIGVSIMLLDDQMDHGPILIQQPLPITITDDQWPVSGPFMDSALAHLGGALLANTLPLYLNGEITPTEQNHDKATYCGRLSKADAELSDFDPNNLPSGDVARHYMNMVAAFVGIGDTWFTHAGKRIKIKEAEYVHDTFRPLVVIPEGKGPQAFSAWHQANCTASNDQCGTV